MKLVHDNTVCIRSVAQCLYHKSISSLRRALLDIQLRSMWEDARNGLCHQQKDCQSHSVSTLDYICLRRPLQLQRPDGRQRLTHRREVTTCKFITNYSHKRCTASFATVLIASSQMYLISYNSRFLKVFSPSREIIR